MKMMYQRIIYDIKVLKITTVCRFYKSHTHTYIEREREKCIINVVSYVIKMYIIIFYLH